MPTEQQAATAAALARAPFDELQVQSQAETLARLQADPLARGALSRSRARRPSRCCSRCSACCSAVVGDVRDERGELFDLEAQGAAPATSARTCACARCSSPSFGIAGGLVLGAILSALVISLVSVTAGAAEPEPPLRLALDLPLLAAAAVALRRCSRRCSSPLATTTRGASPARAAEAAA